MVSQVFWLRSEHKAMEQRCPLSPSLCQWLIQQGCQVFVERSSQRIFSDQDYEQLILIGFIG